MDCILHIGTEKTGTTLLQNWLYSNQKILSQNGIFLSNILEKTNNQKFVAYFQDDFDDYFYRNLVFNNEDKRLFFSDFENAFERENSIAKANHHTMIITSEHFHSRLRNKNQIKKLRDFLYKFFERVKVICYFREQSEMHLSMYSTAVKISNFESVQEYQKDISDSDYYYNHYKIAKNWSTVWGRDNCIFRIYDRSKFPDRDIRKDFLNICCDQIEPNSLDFSISNANESLSYLEAELYKVINKKIPHWNKNCEGTNPGNASLKRSIRKCKTMKFGSITNEKIDIIFNRFVESNQKFFNEFFDGQYLFPKAISKKVNTNASTFSLTQVKDMLVELLSVIIDNHFKEFLRDSDAEVLRDIALKYESKAPLSKTDAYQLMRLANRARSDGSFIKKKLIDFSSDQEDTK